MGKLGNRRHAYPNIRPVKGQGYFWTPERVAVLRAEWGSVAGDPAARAALADRLGTTPVALLKQGQRLGLSTPIDTWTPEEDRFIRTYYGILPVKAVAAKLGRPYGTVRHKAHRLGLHTAAHARAKRLGEATRLVRAELDRLRVLLAVAHHGLLTAEEAAPLLGCRPAEVHVLVAREAATGARLIEEESRR